MTEPRWRRYLRFFRRDASADVDDELRFHFDERVAQFRASGMSHDEAVEAAHTQFGDVPAVRSDLIAIGKRVERSRGASEWLDALRADLRTALRGLARQPAFSAAVIVTLALGLGVNAAMFSFLDRVYLRMPSGVAEPGALRRMWSLNRTRTGEVRASGLRLGGADYEAVKAAFGAEARLALFAGQPTVRVGDEPENNTYVVRADADYLPLLGVRALKGRFFTKEEVVLDSPAHVAVISHDFWRSRFGSDSSILGKPLVLTGVKYTIIGIAQPGFRGVDLQTTDIWVPLGNSPIGRSGGGMWAMGPPRYFSVLVRVSHGASDDVLAARATTTIRRSNSQFAADYDSLATVQLGSIIEARGPGVESKEINIASRLGGVAVLVLIIACANVINLLLAHAVARRREIAVRVALGISRARLVWLLSIPAVMLSLVAGTAAAASAQVTGAILRARLTPDIHFAGSPIHWRVVAFTLLVALLAGAISALLPALQSSRPDVTTFLKAGAQTGAIQRSRLRTVLVVAQAALSIVLLVGAGLFVSSVRNVESIRLGFGVSRLTFASPQFDGSYDSPDSATLWRAAERVRHVPSVEGVAISSVQPLSGSTLGVSFYTATDSSKTDAALEMPNVNVVSENFFDVTGLRIVHGRGFEGATGASIVVSQAFADKYWPRGDAIGQCMRLRTPTEPCFTVIGVVEDTHVRSVIEERRPQFYLSLTHMPFKGMNANLLVIRSDPANASSVVNATRAILMNEFPGSRAGITRLEDALAPQYRPFRLGAALFGVFGLLALLVATVGVYSSVSYSVSQRTHEFGVRIALGAAIGDVLGPVVRRALAPVVVGIAIGLAIALASGRLIASLLYGIEPWDVGVMLVVAFVLVAAATLAALLPAGRAARVDPMIALRAE
jgi:predicted permease